MERGRERQKWTERGKTHRRYSEREKTEGEQWSILQTPFNRNLHFQSHKYKEFTSKYNTTVVIYALRGFIKLATDRDRKLRLRHKKIKQVEKRQSKDTERIDREEKIELRHEKIKYVEKNRVKTHRENID